MITSVAEARFWNKVGPHDDPNSCWVWGGALVKSRGLAYGHLEVDYVFVLAHRFSYELHCGSIPKGVEVDHLCRNTLCVNPKHMELVSHQENVLRGIGIASVNAHKTHCPAGHLYDASNTYWWQNSRGCRICRLENQRLRRHKNANKS